MPSLARTRSRPYGSLPKIGKRTQTGVYLGTPVGPNVETSGTGLSRGTEVCDDYITVAGPYEPHPLAITKREMTSPGIVGTYRQKYRADWYYDWTYDGYCTATRLTDVKNLVNISPPLFDPGYWATKALSNLNPERPSVDALNFLWELREFPSMIRDMGRVLSGNLSAGDVPGGHLAIEYGWAPLLDDLRSLHLFMEESQKRLRELSKANTGRTIQRTLSNTETPILYLPGSNVINLASFDSKSLIVAMQAKWKRRVWFSGTYTMDPDAKAAMESLLSYPTPARLGHMLGLNNGLSAATIWNAIPWSFIIDYFLGVGNFLEAIRGSIPYNIENLCLMVHDEYEETTEVVRNDLGFNYTPHLGRVDVKRRFVVGTATPVIGYKPALTAGQMANIGALVTAGGLRSFR